MLYHFKNGFLFKNLTRLKNLNEIFENRKSQKSDYEENLIYDVTKT